VAHTAVPVQVRQRAPTRLAKLLRLLKIDTDPVFLRWLDEQPGPHGRGAIGVLTDSVYFYFLSADDARAFVGRFSCGLVIEGEWEGPVDRWGRFKRT